MPIINLVYEAPEMPKWNGDISKATIYTTLTTSSSSEQMEFGIQFNPDGTKWYSACYNAANAPVIKQWTLSTPRDITTSTLQWSSQKGTASPRGSYPSIYICNNGNYVYFCDNPHPNFTTGLIYLYSLSTPRDLSSTWTQIKTFSKQKIQKITWVSDDGKAFITAYDDATNSRYMFYSTSSTAWDWNSSGTTLMGNSGWSAFSNDGTKVYLTQDNSKVVYEYSLSTPYNPTTKTLVQSKTLDTVSNLLGITFDTGGDNLYVCANSRPSANYIYQYSLVRPKWKPGANTIGYWELNGNGDDTKNDYGVTTYTATDYDAVGYYGSGLPSYVSGRGGKQCASFDGARTLKLPVLPIPSNTITISARVNYSSASTTGNGPSIFQLKQDVAGGSDIEKNSWSVYFRIQNGTTLAPFFVYGPSGSSATGAYSFTGTALSTGEWHNVVFTFNAGVAKYYIDGTLKETHTVSGGYLRSQGDTPSNIGGTVDIYVASQRVVGLTGLIQDVIYENTARSDQDVADYYARN